VISFIARPVGGLIFRHYGDILGRKKLLVISLLMMGSTTFAIGLLPGQYAIGVVAPILLVLLQLIQGFGAGRRMGRGGAHRLRVRRPRAPRLLGELAASRCSTGPTANGLLALLGPVQSEDAFLSWGWRIPFLLSAVLVLIGLFIRLSIEESPVFRAAQARVEARTGAGEKTRMPIIEVFRQYPREVFTAMGGARFAENVSY
jgi:MFS family permease